MYMLEYYVIGFREIDVNARQDAPKEFPKVQLQAQTKAVEVPVNLVHEQPVEVEQVQTIDVITQARLKLNFTTLFIIESYNIV